MTKKIYFETTNLNLAVFLYFKNKLVAGVNPNKKQRKYTFINNDSIQELIYLYEFGDRDDERLLIPIHQYKKIEYKLLTKINS